MCQFNCTAAMGSIQGRWELLWARWSASPHLPQGGKEVQQLLHGGASLLLRPSVTDKL